MVHGVWVDVLPGPGGAAVARLDSGAVRLQVRFHNDVAEARTVGREDLTLEMPPAIYPPLTDRSACPAWTLQTLRIDAATADLALCFAVPRAANVDPEKLVLNWRQSGDSVQVSLGKAGPGTFSFGGSPSPA